MFLYDVILCVFYVNLLTLMVVVVVNLISTAGLKAYCFFAHCTFVEIFYITHVHTWNNKKKYLDILLLCSFYYNIGLVFYFELKFLLFDTDQSKNDLIKI